MNTNEPIFSEQERKESRGIWKWVAIIGLIGCLLVVAAGIVVYSLRSISQLIMKNPTEVVSENKEVGATAIADPSLVSLGERRSELSGEWSGMDTLTAVGSCQLAGGNQATNPVRMIWHVKDNGDVSITLPDWPGVFPYTFEGRVEPDLRVFLELSSSAMCDGQENPFSSIYQGVIRRDGKALVLDMESTELWCPGGCEFRRQYSVRRTLPAQ